MTQPPTPLQSYLPGSHDIMYLLTCELAVSRFATIPSVPQIGQTLADIRTAVAHGYHFCGSAWALRSDIDRSFQPRANLHRWPTPKQSKSVVSLEFLRAAVRHHSGDTGGDAHMRVSHQVDVPCVRKPDAFGRLGRGDLE